jgi:starch synthase
MFNKLLSYYTASEEKMLKEKNCPYIIRPDYWRGKMFRIMIVSPEVNWVGIQSGGLADAVGNLALTLAGKGVATDVVLPLHMVAKEYLFKNHIQRSRDEKRFHTDLSPYLDSNRFWQRTKYKAEQHKPAVEQYTIEENLTCTLLTTEDQYYFGREKSIYAGMNAQNGPSDGERSILFAWLVAAYHNLRSEQYKDPANLIHCHDWFCGLVAFFEKLLNGKTNTPTMFSLHNIYNNSVDVSEFDRLSGRVGFDGYASIFNPFDRGGFYLNDRMDFLAAGLKWSDYVATVSPKYHDELLASRAFSQRYFDIIRMLEDEHIFDGIINGYNPEYEMARIMADYPVEANGFDPENIEDIRHFKRNMKQAVQAEKGFEDNPNAMLLVFLNRWDDQKSYKETIEVVGSVMQRNPKVQLAVTGTRITPEDHAKEKLFIQLRESFPKRVVIMDWEKELARRLLLVGDLNLMPSKYEPCGLNQIFGFPAATITLGNRVGGLADTIVDTGDVATQAGFLFDGMESDGSVNPDHFIREYTEKLFHAVGLHHRPSLWNRIQENVFKKRFEYNWDAVTNNYLYKYGYILARRMWAAYSDHLPAPLSVQYFQKDWLLPERK